MQITAVRVTAAAFFAVLMLGWREIAHEVVDLGAMAWLLVLGAIFWGGIVIENQLRKTDGRSPYSWDESRELVKPLMALAAVIVIAYCIR